MSKSNTSSINYMYLCTLCIMLMYAVFFYFLHCFMYKVLCVDIFEIYFKYIRQHLIAPFVTTGSFLLSLVVLVVFNLKEKFIESKEYMQSFENIKDLFNRIGTPYKPIINIGRLMCVSMLLCYISSIVQYTIPFFHEFYSTLIAISISATTLTTVIFLIIKITYFLDEYLKLLEEK